MAWKSRGVYTLPWRGRVVSHREMLAGVGGRSLNSGAVRKGGRSPNPAVHFIRVDPPPPGEGGSSPHSSLALLNANDDTRLVFSSRIKVRVIGGSARWLQFSRSQSLQLTPIGVPSAFSRSIPRAKTMPDPWRISTPDPMAKHGCGFRCVATGQRS